MKMLVVVLVCLITGAALAGCVSDIQADDNAKALIAPVYGEQNPAARTAANGANDFAFRLSAALAGHIGDENLVCSPFSVWLPLAALVNAADEAGRPALLEALGAAGIGADDINIAASRMLYDLTRQREKEFYGADKANYPVNDPLKIANAIFVDKNLTLKQGFARDFTDYFRGSLMGVDFSSDEAVEAVNKWAADNTEGLIDRIIDEFDEQTIAAIANAIYFSDKWAWEFDPGETAEDVFHSPAGETAAFFMLREGDGLMYYEDGLIQAMPLWFASGGGMYILLPKDGDAAGLLASMTLEYFGEIQRDSRRATGRLLLPRFSIESGVMPLKDILISLGVPLFDEEAAHLTGGLVEENLDVWLSDAVQKAVIEVDERGTTAAAVTVMAVAGTAMLMPTEPFEMKCDRPFVFILYGNTYDGGGQVLFTGFVNQP